MTSMDELASGFAILRRYDEASAREVNSDYDIIFAGSQDLELEEYSADDRTRLEELGWHFDEDITRWAIYT
jgi:hypothetical protein